MRAAPGVDRQPRRQNRRLPEIGVTLATAAQSFDHPLSAAQQTRNVVLFSACTSLQYLAGPLIYVGPQQGALCAKLGASNLVANLPEIAFSAMTITPAFLAWWLPDVALLKRILAACYLLAAASLALVAIGLVTPISNELRIAAIVLQGAAIGATVPTAIALLWEAIGRGAHESRRGQALGLAFGFGPFLALGSSLVAQELMTGRLWGFLNLPLEPPWNSVAVFGSGVPLLILAAILSMCLVIPPAVEQPTREPILNALAEFLQTPVLAKATLVTVLLYASNTIVANMNLYTNSVLPGDAQTFVNYQYAIRFGCKGVVGLLLGLYLIHSNPRAGVLVTGSICVASLIWALFVTGPAYLFAFGLYGAGELIGVYAPNYILSASSPVRIRQNMAFVTMMMFPAAPFGYLFGALASGSTQSPAEQAMGLRLSFVVCAAILIVGVGLAVVLLPKWPSRAKTEPEQST
jgi:MFS family permease